MAKQANSINMAGMTPAMNAHDLMNSATVVITDAHGKPISQKEIEIAQNPGYLTRIKQAASKHPWMGKALIGAGTVAAFVPRVAAETNSTFDFSFIGDIGHSLITSLTPLGADVQEFLKAWVGPAVEIIIVLVIVGVAFAFRDKIESWAKKL